MAAMEGRANHKTSEREVVQTSDNMFSIFQTKAWFRSMPFKMCVCINSLHTYLFYLFISGKVRKSHLKFLPWVHIENILDLGHFTFAARCVKESIKYITNNSFTFIWMLGVLPFPDFHNILLRFWQFEIWDCQKVSSSGNILWLDTIWSYCTIEIILSPKRCNSEIPENLFPLLVSQGNKAETAL